MCRKFFANSSVLLVFIVFDVHPNGFLLTIFRVEQDWFVGGYCIGIYLYYSESIYIV